MLNQEHQTQMHSCFLLAIKDIDRQFTLKATRKKYHLPPQNNKPSNCNALRVYKLFQRNANIQANNISKFTSLFETNSNWKLFDDVKFDN